MLAFVHVPVGVKNEQPSSPFVPRPHTRSLPFHSLAGWGVEPWIRICKETHGFAASVSECSIVLGPIA